MKAKKAIPFGLLFEEAVRSPETAIAPTDPVLKKPSETGFQLRPPSSVFQTPPPVAPMKYVKGWLGIPATAVTLPPLKGPIQRHFIAL